MQQLPICIDLHMLSTCPMSNFLTSFALKIGGCVTCTPVLTRLPTIHLRQSFTQEDVCWPKGHVLISILDQQLLRPSINHPNSIDHFSVFLQGPLDKAFAAYIIHGLKHRLDAGYTLLPAKTPSPQTYLLLMTIRTLSPINFKRFVPKATILVFLLSSHFLSCRLLGLAWCPRRMASFIHHSSSPAQCSINDGINKANFKPSPFLHWQCHFRQSATWGKTISEINNKSAFGICPMHRADWPLFGKTILL